MATIRSFLSRFKSASRPSLGGSGTFSSIAKRQAAAEDAIYDNQYADGNLSADSYLANLKTRLTRTWITPLQTVTLNEKIGNVQQDVNDAQVNRDYAAGNLTTADVLGYEKAKLDKMTEPTSQAYINQQKKVQGFQDKMERENRTNFRVAKNKRISTMPEDTSQRLYAKAAEYNNLANQARLDGDAQQGDVFETSANNYTQAAKRAEINDLITGAQQTVSQTPTPTGVPSAESGAQTYGDLTGQQIDAGNTGAGVGTQGANNETSVSSSFNPYQTPEVKRALESLDASKQTLNRLYQEKIDKQTLISKYTDAVNKATGDQKTQLQIHLNNLKDSMAVLDNQIQSETQNVQDKVGKISDVAQRVTEKNFTQEVRKTNIQFDKSETELEDAFRKGQISKEEYIAKATAFADVKSQYLGKTSDIFNQLGNDSSAEAYLTKASDAQKVHETLTSVKDNIDSYEPIHVDKGGSVTNIMGKAAKPGDIVLQDVRQQKDSGLFDYNYVFYNNSWHQVYAPETDSITGIPNQKFNQSTAFLQDNRYIYSLDDKGKVVQVPVKSVQFTDENGKPSTKFMAEPDVNKLVTAGTLIRDDRLKGFRQKTPAEMVTQKVGQGIGDIVKSGISKLQNITPEETGAALNATLNPAAGLADLIAKMPNIPNIGQIIKNIQGTAGNVGQSISNAITNANKFGAQFTPQNLIKQGVSGVSGAVNKIADVVRPAVQGVGRGISNFVASVPETVKALPGKIFGILSGRVPITQAFGNVNPSVEVFNRSGINTGADLGAKYGDPVGVPEGQWKVVEAFNQARGAGYIGNNINRGYGNSVLVQNTETGEKIRVSHLSQVNVRPGQVIQGGDVVGAIGNTGNVTGTHLDLEYYKPNGQVADIFKSQYANQVFGTQKKFPTSMPPSQLQPDLRSSTQSESQSPNFSGPSLPGVVPLRSGASQPSQPSQPSSPSVRSNVSAPSAQPRPSAQPQNFIQQAVKNVQKVATPVIQNVQKAVNTVPKIPLPQNKPLINLQPVIQKVQQAAAPVIQRVQQAAAPVVQRVQQAAQNVGNFVSNLFRRR